MKFQIPNIHHSKTRRYTRTHRQTDRQAQTNMPFQLFQSWGHKNLNRDSLWVNITIDHEHTVCARYGLLFTSFCFDFSMTLQPVESYSVCCCMMKS